MLYWSVALVAHISFSSVGLLSGADMDVCLTNFGHCIYISAKHACIFYDEVSTYSMFYATVNIDSKKYVTRWHHCIYLPLRALVYSNKVIIQ